MKRLAYTLIGFFLLLVVVSACKEDEEETTLSSDCYISNFTLGAMKRLVHFTDVTGKDTTYYVAFMGNNYPLNINQVEQTILLQTPLPMDTKLDAVLATVKFEGALTYRVWDNNAADTTWHTYSSTDSIDFSQPLRFRVYASDGRSYRDYYMRLDTRTSEPNAYTWEQVKSAMCAPEDSRKLVNWQQSLFLMIRDEETGICDWMQSEGSDEIPLGKAWAEWVTFGGESQQLMTDPATLVVYNDSLWVCSADGRQLWTHSRKDPDFKLHHTFDGTSGPATLALFAATGHALYGLGTTSSGQQAIFCSVDGSTWNPMATDANLSLFPTAPVAENYIQLNGNERVLVAGITSANAKTCEIWSLLEDTGEPWTYFIPSGDNRFRLPAQNDLNILQYNNLLIAIGAVQTNGAQDKTVACHVSHDNGITWKSDGNLSVPSEVTSQTGRLSATVIDDYIWLSIGEELWRARLNSYGE